MPKDLIYYLRLLDFKGPYAGGKHQYMRRGATTVGLPNPHRGEIGEPLLLRVLRQAKITRSEWEEL
jgi:hypothetical protein